MDLPTQRVLLIEDNEDDYMIVRDLLADITTHRFDLEWVETVEMARQALNSHKYDLCLVDNRLVGRSGLALIEEQLSGDPPFILLTGEDDHEIDLAATRAGAMDYLIKGQFTAPLLERSMRYAIERSTREVTLKETLLQRDLLSMAISNLTDGMILTDATKEENPIIFSNPAFSLITGYAPDEILGRNCRFLQGAETDPQIVQQMREALEEQRAFKGVIRNYRKDGLPFWNGIKIMPVFDENGDLTNFMAFQADITARHQAEMALHESEANLAKAQQIARLGSWELELSNLQDFNSHTLRWSDETFRIMGYEPGKVEACNENFLNAVHPEDREKVGAAME